MKGIILASFGTSHEDALESSIHKVLRELKSRYPEYYINESFSSEMVRKIVQKKQNKIYFNLPGALKDMEEKGINDITVLALYVIEGVEYEKILAQAEEYNHDGRLNIKFTTPLLSDEKSYGEVSDILLEIAKEKDTPHILMGHGSYHKMDSSYQVLQDILDEKSGKIFVGTVEGSISIEDILEKLNTMDYKEVVLTPFLLVAGDHAKEDMASDDEDSWASILRDAGYNVDIQIKGLCERDFINNYFLAKLEEIL